MCFDHPHFSHFSLQILIIFFNFFQFLVVYPRVSCIAISTIIHLFSFCVHYYNGRLSCLNGVITFSLFQLKGYKIMEKGSNTVKRKVRQTEWGLPPFFASSFFLFSLAFFTRVHWLRHRLYHIQCSYPKVALLHHSPQPQWRIQSFS